MTLDEAKKIFINRGYIKVDGGEIFNGDAWRDAVFTISKWLEQEPCDDAISREDAKISLVQFMRNQKSLCECIDDCSSVQLKVKTAYWKPNFRYGMYPGEEHFICSECNGQSMRQSKYCPECGLKMEGGD